MKTLLNRFADKLISKEQLKNVKGGYNYCAAACQGDVDCAVQNCGNLCYGRTDYGQYGYGNCGLLA